MVEETIQTSGEALGFGCLWGIYLVLSHLHPNENVYFNALVGGAKGAMGKNLIDRQITYGNIYKQAALWLNKNAEKNARIAFLGGPLFALSSLDLREDINISPLFFSGFDREGEYLIALYSSIDLPVFGRRYLFRFLNPVQTIDVAGAPILYIFKNSPEIFIFGLPACIIHKFRTCSEGSSLHHKETPCSKLQGVSFNKFET